jgi:hypothetical protein
MLNPKIFVLLAVSAIAVAADQISAATQRELHEKQKRCAQVKKKQKEKCRWQKDAIRQQCGAADGPCDDDACPSWNIDKCMQKYSLALIQDTGASCAEPTEAECKETFPLNRFTQQNVDDAYAQGKGAGAASVTPEDGITQADVDDAYAKGKGDGAASVTIADVDPTGEYKKISEITIADVDPTGAEYKKISELTVADVPGGDMYKHIDEITIADVERVAGAVYKHVNDITIGDVPAGDMYKHINDITIADVDPAGDTYKNINDASFADMYKKISEITIADVDPTGEYKKVSELGSLELSQAGIQCRDMAGTGAVCGSGIPCDPVPPCQPGLEGYCSAVCGVPNGDGSSCPGVFATKSELTAAVDEWVVDRTTAEATHGAALSNWDTSRVEDLSYIFSQTRNSALPGMFNSELNWDTSRAKSLVYTFYDADLFNRQLDWDTGKVTTMLGTFASANTFTQLLDWDTSSVTDFEFTFYNVPGTSCAAQTLFTAQCA